MIIPTWIRMRYIIGRTKRAVHCWEIIEPDVLLQEVLQIPLSIIFTLRPVLQTSLFQSRLDSLKYWHALKWNSPIQNW